MYGQKKVLGNDPSSTAQGVFWECGNWKEIVFIFAEKDFAFWKTL